MLMTEGGGLVTVVQAVVVAVTPPTLLDTAAVGAGKLARLALGRGHVGWVRQASDAVCVQHLVFGAGTLAAPRGGQAQAVAAAVVHPAFVGTHCEGGAAGWGRGGGEGREWVVAGSGTARDGRQEDGGETRGWRGDERMGRRHIQVRRQKARKY